MKHLPPSAPVLPDQRFRQLLSDRQWMRLPAAIRRRFSKRLGPGVSVLYQGHVTQMQMSMVGRIMAQVARLIGAPLPFDTSCVGRPAIVAVTEDTESNGQFWVRQYNRSRGFPQVVHSSKRFAGPTGLEEYIGHGIGMALTVKADDDALHFVSDHYFVQLKGRRLRLTRWLSPGDLVITHRYVTETKFLFSLTLTHPKLGQIIHQDAVFHDA